MLIVRSAGGQACYVEVSQIDTVMLSMLVSALQMGVSIRGRDGFETRPYIGAEITVPDTRPR
jgi:hypothetical protein